MQNKLTVTKKCFSLTQNDIYTRWHIMNAETLLLRFNFSAYFSQLQLYTLLLIWCNMCMYNNAWTIVRQLNICSKSSIALYLFLLRFGWFTLQQMSHNLTIHSWVTLSQTIPSNLVNTLPIKLNFLSQNFNFVSF